MNSQLDESELKLMPPPSPEEIARKAEAAAAKAQAAIASQST